ncbi:MAG: CHRD domain-containing protein [Planctomycetota bacterium]
MKLLLAPAIFLTAASAQADLVNFVFPINVEQEVPVPDVAGFNPSGSGDVTLDTDTNELTWTIAYEGLTGGIVAPGAHFHGPADFGATAGVEIFISTGDPAEPASGILMGSATLDAQQASDLLAGLWYVNIHTSRNASGEIRGQVVPAPAALAAIGGLSLLGTRRRR